jgi:hypothetical protein
MKGFVDSQSAALKSKAETLNPFKQTLLFAAILSVLPPILAHAYFSIAYRTCDDIIMSLLPNRAGLASAPNASLGFINYAIGQLLVELATVAPDVNWYYGLGSGLHLLATLVFVFVILRRSLRFTTLVPLSIYLFVFDFYYWLNPQFTITAFLLGQSAAILLLETVRRLSQDESTRGLPWTLLAATLLLLLSYMYREASALLAICLTAPLLGLTVMSSLSVKRQVCLGAYSAAVCAALYSLSWYHDYMLEVQAGWPAFRSYNIRLSSLNDTLPSVDHERLAAALDRVKWSENDWRMLRSWFCYDSDRFSLETLTELNNALGVSELGAHGRDWRQLFKMLARVEYRPWLLGLCAISCLALLGMRPLLRTGVVVGTALAILVLLAVRLKLELHVITPTLGFCAAYMVLERTRATHANSASAAILAKTCRWGVTIVGIALGIWAATNAWRFNTARSAFLAERERAYCCAIEQLARDYPRELIVDWGGALNYDCFPAARTVTPFKQLRIALLTSHTRAPFVRDRFREYGIGDPYRALFERDDVVLMAWDPYPPLLVAYVREHYDVKIAATLVKDYKYFFKAYRFRAVQD